MSLLLIFEEYFYSFRTCFYLFPHGDVANINHTTNIFLYHRPAKTGINIASLHGYKDFIRKSGFEKYSDYNVYIDNKVWR